MISGVLGMGRKQAKARMTESVTVGRYELERASGALNPTLTLKETFYTGSARVKFPSAAAQVKAPAGQQVAETNIVVSLPAGTSVIATGSYVKVTASAADSALVGRMFRVDGPAQAGQTTAHRYPVVEES